jgi:hypothetical protein
MTGRPKIVLTADDVRTVVEVIESGRGWYEAGRRIGVSGRTLARIATDDADFATAVIAARARHAASLKKWQHGTTACYQQSRCRCKPCKRAEYRRMYKNKTARLGRTPPTHGLSGYTNWDCRCDVCKAAGSVKNAADRKRRREAAS